VAPGLSILVYPSDIALQGEKPIVARTRAAIVARLTHTEAYLTASAEAQRFEDRLAAIRDGGVLDADAFRGLDEELARVAVPYDDWETLYRLRLQVENELRGSRSGLPGAPHAAESPSAAGSRASLPEWGAAVGMIALLLADVILRLGDLRGHRS
jgi:hypothetical protein